MLSKASDKWPVYSDWFCLTRYSYLESASLGFLRFKSDLIHFLKSSKAIPSNVSRPDSDLEFAFNFFAGCYERLPLIGIVVTTISPYWPMKLWRLLLTSLQLEWKWLHYSTTTRRLQKKNKSRLPFPYQFNYFLCHDLLFPSDLLAWWAGVIFHVWIWVGQNCFRDVWKEMALSHSCRINFDKIKQFHITTFTKFKNLMKLSFNQQCN